MNEPTLLTARQHFVAGMSRIAKFWGFPKAMGAIYAAIYLSPEPLSLDEIVEAVGVTKGGLVVHLRGLERLGVVERENRAGDRKDYYVAATDFWGVVRRILREREKREFDRALRSVEESLQMLKEVPSTKDNVRLVRFYRERLSIIHGFFKSIDRVVVAILAMESFHQDFFERLLGRKERKERKGT